MCNICEQYRTEYEAKMGWSDIQFGSSSDYLSMELTIIEDGIECDLIAGGDSIHTLRIPDIKYCPFCGQELRKDYEL